MSPLVMLAVGLTLLVALSVPMLRIYRTQAAQRRHMMGRLALLRVPAEEIAEITAPRNEARFLIERAPRSLRVGLARAGITLQWRHAVLIACSLIGCSAGGFILGGPAIGAAMGLLAMALGWIGFQIVTQRRLAAFVEGLPLYLDATRQLIMVGHSLQQAMVTAGEGCGPGVARHIGPVIRRIQYGATPGDAIVWLAERIDVVELHMLAAAVKTNTRHGGRISTVLANLTQILRDRARVGRELTSATAETRMSGIVLGALPVVVALFIAFSNPSYIRFFIDVPEGHTLLAVAVGMEIVGVLIMRRIMRLDF
jgi:tight adherence protein B